VWLSPGRLFPSHHKRNDTPVSSVGVYGSGRPSQELGRIGPQRIPRVPYPSPAQVVVFNFGGCPLKLRLSGDSEEAAPATREISLALSPAAS
jgi:hypothetical protein